MLFGCFICQMGLGAGYVFGATLKHIVAEFEWSRTAFAAASAPLLLSMALAQPLVGHLSERVGTRAVVSSATLLLGASLWLFSQMESLWVFYATSLLFGVALAGLGDVAVGGLAARWVPGRRGLALALVYVGSNVGGALVPSAAEALAAAASWRLALQVIGLAAVLLILPFALFVVREPSRLPEASDAEPEMHTRAALDLSEALRTRSFWVLAFVLFSFYFYYLGLNQHLVAFLSDVGFSDARAAASLGFAVGLGILSKLGVGLVADRISPRAALAANLGVLCAGSWLVLLADRPGVLPVFLVAHGLAVAAENVLLPLVVAECFGVTHLARIYGMLMVTLGIGGVLGPLYAGVVFDRLGDYRVAFGTFAALNLAALCALPALRPEKGRS